MDGVMQKGPQSPEAPILLLVWHQFVSTPVLMRSGIMCIAFCLSFRLSVTLPKVGVICSGWPNLDNEKVSLNIVF